MPEGTLEARPKLSGVYWDWRAEAPDQAAVLPVGGIVAVAGTHDWGPLNTPTMILSPSHFRTLFGPTESDLSRSVTGAFRGEGWGGKAGASAVIVYRQGVVGTAAAATRSLQNTTPAAALTITAKYPGVRGNNLKTQVQAGVVGGQKDLLIYDGSQVVEKYTFVSTDIAGAAALVNATSKFVTATSVITGVALADSAATNLAGGNDGAVLTGTEWTATFNSLDTQRWSVFAPANLTDATIRASLIAWIQSRNTLGHRAYAVIGGAIDETTTTANSRSTATNDPNITNLGVGRLRLLAFGNLEVSTAQFAARYAGAIAFRGEKFDMVYVRFADVELVTGPSLAEQDAAFSAGTTVFTRDTHADAPVHVRDGTTSYSNDTASPVDELGVKKRPVAWYSRTKNVRIQHGVELEVDERLTDGNMLGLLANTERVQGIIKGFYEEAYQRRETAEILQPGWSVEIVEASLDNDYVKVRHGFHPTRSLRQMFNEVTIG